MTQTEQPYGLIGRQLGHSHSPRLHALLGGPGYALIPLEPEALDGFLRQDRFAGLNVTIPYKQSVMPYCARLSDTAREIGSVNTLVRQADGSLFGDNTDAYGFEEMARQAGVRFAGEKTLVLGSGGTSRTACAVIRAQGGEAVVVSRGGEDNYENLSRHKDAAFVVNTTPVGMAPAVTGSPLDLRLFPGLRGVLDVVYNPLRTRLLQQAQELHIPWAGGLSMLVAQAARARELFSGQPVPSETARQAYAALRRSVMNLVLVGMPGCGKTTLGRRLSQLLDLPLTDVDREIEKTAGYTIPEIFRREGETGFRRREAKQIARCSGRGGQILVTGGGAVLSLENRQNLRMNGFVVHITRPVNLLPLAGRPLSTDQAALAEMWRLRQPLYEACADVCIANEAGIEECAGKMKEAFDEAVCH